MGKMKRYLKTYDEGPNLYCRYNISNEGHVVYVLQKSGHSSRQMNNREHMSFSNKAKQEFFCF